MFRRQPLFCSNPMCSTFYSLQTPALFLPLAKMRPAGIEPTTVRLEGGCSIQLSYERVSHSVSRLGGIGEITFPATA